MRIGLIVCSLFLLTVGSGCERTPEPGMNATSTPALTPSPAATLPTPERFPTLAPKASDDNSDFIRLLNADLGKVGERPLREVKLQKEDFEVRIWSGFSLRVTKGIAIRRNGEKWSGERLSVDLLPRKGTPTKISIENPKSGWEAFWQRLMSHRLLELRDDAEVGAVEPFDDSEVVLVETLVGGKYRTYKYNGLCFSGANDALELVEIMKVVREEVDGSWYLCDKDPR